MRNSRFPEAPVKDPFREDWSKLTKRAVGGAKRIAGGLRTVSWSGPIVRGSLRRQVRRELRVAPQVLLNRRVDRLLAQRRSTTALICLSVVGLIWLPLVDVDAGTFAPGKATDYLTALWGVIATTLGLSMAMIGFVFQAFVGSAGRSLGGSLREFADETHLEVALWLGFSSLMANGFVLLGWGHQAPDGWAALVVVALSFATLGVALPVVLHLTLRAMDFSFAVRTRARRVEKQAETAVRQLIEGQQAVRCLDAALGTTQIDQSPLFLRGDFVLRSSKRGTIRNIGIRRLMKLEQALVGTSSSSPAKLTVLVQIGQVVTRDTPLLAFNAAQSSGWERAARKAFRTRRARLQETAGRELRRDLERLHSAAKSAIRRHQHEEWQQIGDIYRKTLLAVLHEAARLGVAFDERIATPGLFGDGPVRQIQGFLQREMQVALEAGDPELADSIGYLPIRIAHDAMELSAPALVHEMLRLYPAIYRSTFER